MKKRSSHLADIVQRVKRSRNSFDKSNKENLFPINQIQPKGLKRNPSKKVLNRKVTKSSNQILQRQSKSVGGVYINNAFQKVKQTQQKNLKKIKIESFDNQRLKTDQFKLTRCTPQLSPRLSPKLKSKKYFEFDKIRNISFKMGLKKNFEQIVKKQISKNQLDSHQSKKKSFSPLRKIKSTKFIEKLTFADYCKGKNKKQKVQKNQQKIKSPRGKKQCVIFDRIFIEKKIIKIDLISLTDLILEIKQITNKSNYQCKNLNGMNLLTIEKVLDLTSKYFNSMKNFLNYYQIFYKFVKNKIIKENDITELSNVILEVFQHLLIVILSEYNRDKKYQIEYNFLNEFVQATFNCRIKNNKQQETLIQFKSTIGIFSTHMNYIIQSLNLDKIYVSNILSQIENLTIKKCNKIATQITKLFKQNNQQKLLERFSDCSIQGQDNELNFLFQPLCQQKKQNFQNNKKEFVLVLDLDETLIHFEENEEGGTFLVRPYVKEFLRDMNQIFELVIYTAAVQEYADWILEKIDPDKLIIKRFY